MTDWIIAMASHAREFPKVQHRHPNGMDADCGRTPTVPHSTSPAIERWTFPCPGCGDVYVWERAVVAPGDASAIPES